MARGKGKIRRTPLQVSADEAAQEVMRKLGRMLRDGRTRLRLRQADVSLRAGISRSEWSGLELGRKQATIATWNRAAVAVGGGLQAYIKETSAATLPRDAVHLRNQELIIRLAHGGGWTALPEEFIDREARSSRAADVLLTRTAETDGTSEYALWDVWDWIEDVGANVRDFTRRMAGVERYAISRMRGEHAPLPRTAGCWVLRATHRNRRLVAEHRNFFRARFPGSGRAWLATLADRNSPLPQVPALIWVAVNADRLFAMRSSHP